MNEVAKKQNRWVPVIASIAIQLCLGTAYIWSVFQTGVAKYLFEGNNAQASLSFSLLLALLTLGSTIGGKLQGKYGTKRVVLIGGFILAIGFFLASMTGKSMPWMIWVSYGVLGGIGMGFTYSTTISCCQRWFPDKRGAITGIIVSALGFGGVIFTPIAEWLIKLFGGGVAGVGELKTLGLLSAVFLVVCTVGAFFIKDPPMGYAPEGYVPPAPKPGVYHQDFTPSEMAKTPQFYLVIFTLLLACMGGLMMIGFAKPIASAKGMANVAAIGVMIISIFNSCGRLTWGIVSDRIGRKNTVLILLIGTAGASLLVNLAVGYWIFGLIALIGFLYGGFLGVFPALTADFWGAKNAGANYGVILLGFGVGAVTASYIAGYFRDVATKANDINAMFPAFVIASGAAVIGAVLMFFLTPPKQKKESN